MIESLLLTATRVFTFEQDHALTNASGFFFERDGRLFLVTSRHVVIDEPSAHRPDRIAIEVHTDADNLALRPDTPFRSIATANACGARASTRAGRSTSR